MRKRIGTYLFFALLAAAALMAFNSQAISAEEIARPTNPGGPGLAATMKGNVQTGERLFMQHCMSCHGLKGKGGVTNSGSTDGTVPPLNPIDKTMVSKDPKVFAYNIDLFVQNGSIPDGPHPAIKMPAWGAKKLLKQQDIADIIAYIMSLNTAK